MDSRWFVALIVAIAAVGAGIWFGRGVTVPIDVEPLPSASQSESSAAVPESTPGIFVHVAGWVESPGLVRLDDGARVGDALAAAGGVRSGAVLTAVNLAQPLSDGEQVFVPGPGEEGPNARPPDGEGDGLVHLNSAGVDDLEKLPGVGPVLAERIVAHRDEMGPFQTVEDLLGVSGIGETKLASMRDLIAVP